MKFPTQLLGARRTLPILLQTEMSECGLASVAMIALYHGHQFEISDLRRQVSLSIKGSTFEDLVNIARALKLNARALKLELESLPALSLPCILHWDMNHFVVLKKVGPRKIHIHDPAVGARALSHDEFGKHFTGVALELSPAADFTPIHARAPLRLRHLIGQVVGLRRGVFQVLALAFALELLAIAMPFQLQWIVDHALKAWDRQLITTLSIGFLALVLLQAGIAAVRRWLITVLSTHLNFQWAGNVFGHLLRLPLTYFEKRHLGAIQSYFGSIDHIQETLSAGFTQAIVDGVMVVVTLGLMMLYNPWLSLVAIAAVVIYGLLRWLAFQALREATAEEIICDSKQHTHFLESVRGIQAIRLFGRENQRRSGWMNLLGEKYNAHLRIEKIATLQDAANSFLFGIERVVMVWLGALAVLRSDFSLGMLFAYISYKEQFTGSVSELIDTLFDLRMLRLHVQRVADIVQTSPENEDNVPELDLSLSDTSIQLKNIYFQYSPTEPMVLNGINLSIQAGECVAITGPSGCGKTTLAKIILGLFKPTSGEVCVGEIPLISVGIANYRAVIGSVMQDDVLYSGTIADNICFFDSAVDSAHVEACAKSAAIHAEIQAMPMGYTTLVGDLGTGLSGGQKQRLLLARALYRRPRILVLDEATSHLDAQNERAVNDAIRSMKLTRIIIAHRTETIQMADRVIALEHGKIVEESARPFPNEMV